MIDRPRVIVALPDPSEGAAVADWLLAEGFDPVRRPTPQAAADEMRHRAFALLIADEALAFRGGLYIQCRARNPLTPTLLIGDAPTATASQAASGQTLYLSRPIDRATLTCFVSMAILDSRPTRRSVRKPINRFEAVVNGVPSHIVDVSAEGLRLEVSRDRRAVLPPYFTVRVPLVGVAMTVQRMWTMSSSGKASTIWYGGALSQNRASIDQAWRSFVETIPAADGSRIQLNPEI